VVDAGVEKAASLAGPYVDMAVRWPALRSPGGNRRHVLAGLRVTRTHVGRPVPLLLTLTPLLALNHNSHLPNPQTWPILTGRTVFSSKQVPLLPASPFLIPFQIVNILVYFLLLGSNIYTIVAPSEIYYGGKETYITPAPWAFFLWCRFHSFLPSLLSFTLPPQVPHSPPVLGHHHLPILPSWKDCHH
jgi:hypothetical protein